MKYRLMTADDYNDVYALWLSCKGMGLNDLDDSEEGIRKFLERNPDTCFLAEEEGKIVGVIMAGNDGRRGYIYHTAVHPDHRRKGIGRKLVELAIDALENEGINKVALVVFKRNEDGNLFWEEVGFTTREDIAYRSRPIKEMVRYDT